MSAYSDRRAALRDFSQRVSSVAADEKHLRESAPEVFVPKGIVHRTRAPNRTIILMVKGAGIVPTGD